MRQCDSARLLRAVKNFRFDPVAAATAELLRVQDVGLNSVSATSIRRLLMKVFTAGVDAVLDDATLQREADLAHEAAKQGGPAV